MRGLILRLIAQSTRPAIALDESARVLGFCFILAAIAGLFGGMVKKLSLRDTLVAAGVSGVGGLVVGAICVALWGPDKWYLTAAACSLAGWAGGNLVLDRLTFVAWTIARGKVPSIGNFPAQEPPHASSPPASIDTLDLDVPLPPPRPGSDHRV